ncbi:hypothetical protein WCP94_000789 (plasmid) [Bilophila wadsworthia]
MTRQGRFASGATAPVREEHSSRPIRKRSRFIRRNAGASG